MTQPEGYQARSVSKAAPDVFRYCFRVPENVCQKLWLDDQVIHLLDYRGEVFGALAILVAALRIRTRCPTRL